MASLVLVMKAIQHSTGKKTRTYEVKQTGIFAKSDAGLAPDLAMLGYIKLHTPISNMESKVHRNL